MSLTHLLLVNSKSFIAVYLSPQAELNLLADL
uniref:Uncharacterized protein n=1 Tax=Siphoviridae sp. ctP0x5 TaxID=2827863 RepID=A0A8S5TFZ1_9CAUD|nr:MAG TPA: hypothetical protein [Siphoviridae sp. ctP0x5]